MSDQRCSGDLQKARTYMATVRILRGWLMTISAKPVISPHSKFASISPVALCKHRADLSGSICARWEADLHRHLVLMLIKLMYISRYIWMHVLQ